MNLALVEEITGYSLLLPSEASWKEVIDLAEKHGWKKEGTLQPGPWETEVHRIRPKQWEKSPHRLSYIAYGSRMAAEDYKGLATAILKALPLPPKQSSKQEHLVKLCDFLLSMEEAIIIYNYANLPGARVHYIAPDFLF